MWRYGEFVEKLCGKYPEAAVILMTTVMEHHRNWDTAIGEVCERLASERVKHFVFRENGQKTPGHIRASEAEEMAGELTGYIKDILTWQ